jgi:hypothetical protein
MLAAIKGLAIHAAGEVAPALREVGRVPDEMIDPHGWHLSAEHLICPARAPSAAGQAGALGKT